MTNTHLSPDQERAICRHDRVSLILAGFAAGTSIVLYYGMNRLISSIVNRYYPEVVELYWSDLTFQYAFDSLWTVAALLLPFALMYFGLRKTGATREPIPLGAAKSPSTALLLIPIGLAACMFGNFIVSYLNTFLQSLFSVEFTMPDYDVPTAPKPAAMYFLRSAILPPLIEELCLRGFIMQPLRRYGDRFAIVMSAFVFALMHGNMVQLPFAFIAGIAIGYCVAVTGTLWTGIAIHFLNNAVSVAESLLIASGMGAKAQLWAVAASSTAIGVGIVCLIVYLFKKRGAGTALRRCEARTPFKPFYYLANPAMIAAIALMGYTTVTYIMDA
ncbi:MAG: CPBP family intramembrane metalloprotease [Clostridia bacterium]|nr:CPBP family intramembrane metalloprotease [Clostridia bacterium]